MAVLDSATRLLLVVEDDPDARAMYRLFFSGTSFTVVEAENGERALERVEQAVPDAVLTDVAMPLMDGVELCRRLRAAPGTQELPIVAVSAQGDDIAASARGAGCDEVLTKPVSFDRLLATLEQAIAAHRAAHEAQHRAQAIREETESLKAQLEAERRALKASTRRRKP